jgi:16S rRNA (uracil1498-N3)-methyltransferase
LPEDTYFEIFPMQRNLQRVTLQATQFQSDRITLTDSQQHYLCRVLRLGVGAEFIALDGKGHWWLAQLQAGLEQAILVSEIATNTELAKSVTIAIAMPKGNGMEDVIRQVTELGASRIVPMWSDRTVVKAGTELGKQKLERWQRIAQEASELSLRQIVPEITAPQTMRDLIAQTDQHKFIKLICVTYPAPHLLTSLQKSLNQPGQAEPDQAEIDADEIMIATGCEGGWTDAEEQAAIAQNWQPVSLGDRILSAVTAPMVALAMASAAIQTHANP